MDRDNPPVIEHGSGQDPLPVSSHPRPASKDESNKETYSSSANVLLESGGNTPPTNEVPSLLRQNIFMVFITLTQLVQMIPLGAGINSSFAIGAALGASEAQSVWIVASYPLTQGTFVLIGKFRQILV